MQPSKRRRAGVHASGGGRARWSRCRGGGMGVMTSMSIRQQRPIGSSRACTSAPALGLQALPYRVWWHSASVGTDRVDPERASPDRSCTPRPGGHRTDSASTPASPVRLIRPPRTRPGQNRMPVDHQRAVIPDVGGDAFDVTRAPVDRACGCGRATARSGCPVASMASTAWSRRASSRA